MTQAMPKTKRRNRIAQHRKRSGQKRTPKRTPKPKAIASEAIQEVRSHPTRPIPVTPHHSRERGQTFDFGAAGYSPSNLTLHIQRSSSAPLEGVDFPPFHSSFTQFQAPTLIRSMSFVGAEAHAARVAAEREAESLAASLAASGNFAESLKAKHSSVSSPSIVSQDSSRSTSPLDKMMEMEEEDDLFDSDGLLFGALSFSPKPSPPSNLRPVATNSWEAAGDLVAENRGGSWGGRDVQTQWTYKEPFSGI